MKAVTRRQMLKAVAAVGAGTIGGGVLGACGATPTPQVIEKQVTVIVAGTPQVQVVKETVQVEKTVVVQASPQVVEKVVTAAPGERPTLEFWWGWGGMTGLEALKGVCDNFNMKNPNVFVHGLNVNMGEKLLTSVSAGTPPDVAVGNIMFSEYCAREVFTALDDFFAASKVVTKGDKDIIASLWKDATWQGKIYGLAGCEVGPRMGMAFNNDLVTKAGLDISKPPLTWDEAYEWHKTMTTFDNTGNLVILGFDVLDAMGGRQPTSDSSFFWADSFGFEWWNQEKMTFDLNNDKFIASLATIKKFYDVAGAEKINGYRTSYGTWTQSPTASFPAGVQGMILNGYWTPGELVHSAPDRKFTFTWAPNSSDRRGKKFQNEGGHPVVIPKGVKNPQLSFSFLEYLTTPEAADIILNTTGWWSPRISWLAKIDVSKFPGADFFKNSLSEADELKPCPLCPIETFVGQQLRVTWDAVNYGDKTPEVAAKELQDNLTSELRKQFPNLAG